MAKSDHCDGRRFFNPEGDVEPSWRELLRMMRSPRQPWPRWLDEPAHQPPPLEGAAAVVTFIGHATFLIQTPAGNLLTDPMYSLRAGPWGVLGPRRVRPPAIRIEDLPPIAAVLLSHNHYDHCDLRTLLRLAQRFDPIVVTSLGTGRLVRSAGIRRVEELDWWQRTTSAGLPVTFTPARHFAARTPFDRNQALWGGFMLEAGPRRIFFAGDSAYTKSFHEIRRRLGPIDLALLPIGAYEPRWFMRHVHMNPAEAVQAHLELEPTESISMHHGTFQLTAEAIDEPIRALAEACVAKGVSNFRTVAPGQTVRLSHK